ncbi:hypothetical protein KKF91_18510 [Myxococcota bacterium]|nr:hypothetical protein [Myxococcota bacterium]MBU1432536.1 hypothetical protein [Myxococcota bacterium]
MRFILNHEDGDVTGHFQKSRRWLDRLKPLRGDLLAGDQRLLYLGFLHAISREELSADVAEPPIPEDLDALTTPLRAFIEFMEIDPRLLDVALEQAPEPTSEEDELPLNHWLATLPESLKDDLLLRAIQGDELAIGLELLAMYRSRGDADAPKHGPRSIGGLIARYHGEAPPPSEGLIGGASAKAPAAKAIAARRRRLEKAIKRSGSGWAEVDRLIETRQPSSYKTAVVLLSAIKESGVPYEELRMRVTTLLDTHKRKKNFVQAVRRAGIL